MISLLLAAVVLSPADVRDWLALRVTTVDSSTVFAHDARSGLVVRYGGSLEGKGAAARLRHSSRLIARQTGTQKPYSWELFELSDPASDVKRLLQDLGQTPAPGSWDAGLVEAYSPPTACEREVKYFVRGRKDSLAVFTAVPCNTDQSNRMRSLVDAYMASSSPAEVVERKAFGPTGRIGPEELAWLRSGPSAQEVLARIGIPDDVWPRYPDGFSLVYDDAAIRENSHAVDFDLLRNVVGVRSFVPMQWEP